LSKKGKSIRIRVEPNVYELIKKLAKKKGVSVSEYFRKMASIEIKADIFKNELDEIKTNFSKNKNDELTEHLENLSNYLDSLDDLVFNVERQRNMLHHFVNYIFDHKKNLQKHYKKQIKPLWEYLYNGENSIE